jgi:hypothetical protein
VGIEANGLIYAYAFNADGTYSRVATIVTGFGAVMDLQFDHDRGEFWAVCDNTCQGRTELLTIDQTTGRSGIAHLYERPVTMPNSNNEGFTPASDFECVNGLKPAFWSDDDNGGGHALRAGTAPCSFTWPPTPHSIRFNGTTGFAEAAASPDLNLTADWTVEAWFKDEDPNGFNHPNRTIVSKGDPASSSDVLFMVQVARTTSLPGCGRMVRTRCLPRISRRWGSTRACGTTWRSASRRRPTPSTCGLTAGTSATSWCRAA